MLAGARTPPRFSLGPTSRRTPTARRWGGALWGKPLRGGGLLLSARAAHGPRVHVAPVCEQRRSALLPERERGGRWSDPLPRARAPDPDATRALTRFRDARPYKRDNKWDGRHGRTRDRRRLQTPCDESRDESRDRFRDRFRRQSPRHPLGR